MIIVAGITHVSKTTFGRAKKPAQIVPHTSMKYHFRNHSFCFCSSMIRFGVFTYISKSFNFCTHVSDKNMVLFQNCTSISQGKVLMTAIALSKSCGSSGMLNHISSCTCSFSAFASFCAVHAVCISSSKLLFSIES